MTLKLQYPTTTPPFTPHEEFYWRVKAQYRQQLQYLSNLERRYTNPTLPLFVAHKPNQRPL